MIIDKELLIDSLDYAADNLSPEYATKATLLNTHTVLALTAEQVEAALENEADFAETDKEAKTLLGEFYNARIYS